MEERRLQLRRGRKALRIVNHGTVRFETVHIGQAFYLTPRDTVRVLWVKCTWWGAQYQDWNNESQRPDQQFPADFPVFIN